MSIVNLPDKAIIELAEAASYADLQGYRLRIETGTNRQGEAWIKWDCGRGWTPPIYCKDNIPVVQHVEIVGR